LVKNIIERHQGQIGVESREGAGSRFYFTLPLAKKATPEGDPLTNGVVGL
jgi:signal transduction histidine kinase